MQNYEKSDGIVISGASGFIGRQLVPRLIDAGCKILLVGRNTTLLDEIFPNIPNCTYEKLADSAQNFSVMLHMAVLNNNFPYSDLDFNRVNVELLAETLVASKKFGVRKFINVSTFQIFDDKKTNYVKSKRAALDMLEQVWR
jgi:nucleoside-diphosphate-sugar epimerase